MRILSADRWRAEKRRSVRDGTCAGRHIITICSAPARVRCSGIFWESEKGTGFCSLIPATLRLRLPQREACLPASAGFLLNAEVRRSRPALRFSQNRTLCFLFVERPIRFPPERRSLFRLMRERAARNHKKIPKICDYFLVLVLWLCYNSVILKIKF